MREVTRVVMGVVALLGVDWTMAGATDAAERGGKQFICGNEYALMVQRMEQGADPVSAVEAFYRAYARMDGVGLELHTHHDFLSQSEDPEFRAAHPQGLTLAGELRVLERIRAEAAASTGSPVALHIEHAGLTIEASGPDTAVVVASRPTLQIRTVAGVEEAVSPRHRFVLVQAERGEERDGRWRIVRWLEELGEPDATGGDTLLAGRTADPAPLAPATDEDLPQSLAFTRAAAEPGPVLAFGVALPRAADVVVSLIDVQGRINERLHAPTLAAGRHTVRLSGSNASPGIYWARLQAGAERRQMRITLVR